MVPEDIQAYNTAIAGFEDAALTEPAPEGAAGHFLILLSEPIGMQLAGQFSLKDWCEHKLTKEQRQFVNTPSNQPIRLKGVAGTGKTQSMAVKCLRDLYADIDSGGDKSVAFLTHSSALAHEIVRGMFFAMDPSERWAQTKTATGHPRLWIGTLYEFAQERLGYEKKGLKPLSLDGRDGREIQRLLIQDAVSAVAKDTHVVCEMFPNCRDLADRITTPAAHTSLIEELMNEFACILDAENIRKGNEKADRYIRSPREQWQMYLPETVHRRVVLEIHDVYQRLLKNEHLLSMDQMIADFSRYLTTHEWTQLREREGFDLIFVDEYHYFTRVEADALHRLFKPRAKHLDRWPLIMAYALKQSTNDAALGGGVERFRNPGVGESVPVELSKVFRSTPQISAFLHDLDGAFPAMNLPDEFTAYAGLSDKKNGESPILLEYQKDINLIDDVFDRAVTLAHALPGGGSQVAVLCLNENLFDRYREASRVKKKSVAVTSREDLRELRYARTRCVFSMPEYVAGLQFDTVFLINVDRADLSDEHVSLGAQRRYISRIYLGASRAENRLIIASSGERGGRSELLKGPLQNGSLIAISS